MPLAIQLPASAESIPHLEQYFGAWAIDGDRVSGLVSIAEQVNLEVHLQAVADQKAAAGEEGGEVLYELTDDGIAVIKLSGTMMKHRSSLFGGASTVWARKQFRAAADDDAVRGVLLMVDTPGGTVAGTDALGTDIAKAAAKKPVVASVEDLCASAGYWVTAQATQIFASRTSLVGSIGAYTVVVDSSKAADESGRKIHVIRSADGKGGGYPGAEVREEDLAEAQRLIDLRHEQFRSAVAEGRGLSAEAVAEVADGRLRSAEDAKSLGLVDGIEGSDEAYEALLDLISTNRPRGVLNHRGTTSSRGNSPMAKTETDGGDTNAKSFEDQLAERRSAIADACDGADDAFVSAQLAAGASPQDAAKAWMKQLAAERDQAKADAKSATEEAENAKNTGRGNDALSEGGDSDSDGDGAAAGEQFEELVQAKVDKGMQRSKAVAMVGRQNPRLREQMVAEANAGRKK